MKSELLLLGGMGAVILLVVVYMTMDDKHPPMALPYVDPNPTGNPTVKRAGESKVVNDAKRIKADTNAAESHLAAAIEQLTQGKAAADMMAKVDPSGAAAAASKGLKEVISVVKEADDKLNAADPIIAGVVGAAVEWGSKPENQTWAWEQAQSLWKFANNPNEDFYKSLDGPNPPTSNPWWY